MYQKLWLLSICLGVNAVSATRENPEDYYQELTRRSAQEALTVQEEAAHLLVESGSAQDRPLAERQALAERLQDYADHVEHVQRRGVTLHPELAGSARQLRSRAAALLMETPIVLPRAVGRGLHFSTQWAPAAQLPLAGVSISPAFMSQMHAIQQSPHHFMQPIGQQSADAAVRHAQMLVDQPAPNEPFSGYETDTSMVDLESVPESLSTDASDEVSVANEGLEQVEQPRNYFNNYFNWRR